MVRKGGPWSEGSVGNEVGSEKREEERMGETEKDWDTRGTERLEG